MKLTTDKLILGTMSLGGEWDNNPIESKDIDEARDVINASLDIGIDTFDHANIYKYGKSEEVFGIVLKDMPQLREKIKIQSKVGIVTSNTGRVPQYDFSKSHIIEEVENSLRRLNTDYLDSLLLHRPDPLMDRENLKDAIDYLFKYKLIKNIGVSNMHLHQMNLLSSYIERPLCSNQLEMSLSKLDWLNSGIYFNTDKSSEIAFPPGTIEYCIKNNIQLQAWSPLAQGKFSGRPLTEDTPQTVISTRDYVSELAEEKCVSPECIVLSWLMKHPANIRPVVGTKNTKRLLSLNDIHKSELTRDEWYKLYELSRGCPIP